MSNPSPLSSAPDSVFEVDGVKFQIVTAAVVVPASDLENGQRWHGMPGQLIRAIAEEKDGRTLTRFETCFVCPMIVENPEGKSFDELWAELGEKVKQAQEDFVKGHKP